MKYIVYLDGNKELMVTFPKCINHDRMAEAMETLRFGGDHDWHRDQGKILSAGFIDGNGCFGESETLGISSRKNLDNKLYQMGGQQEVAQGAKET